VTRWLAAIQAREAKRARLVDLARRYTDRLASRRRAGRVHGRSVARSELIATPSPALVVACSGSSSPWRRRLRRRQDRLEADQEQQRPQPRHAQGHDLQARRPPHTLTGARSSSRGFGMVPKRGSRGRAELGAHRLPRAGVDAEEDHPRVPRPGRARDLRSQPTDLKVSATTVVNNSIVREGRSPTSPPAGQIVGLHYLAEEQTDELGSVHDCFFVGLSAQSG
jgi:hypothetical protein